MQSLKSPICPTFSLMKNRWIHTFPNSINATIIYIYIYVDILTPQHEQYVTQGQFLVELNRFEFRVFLS